MKPLPDSVAILVLNELGAPLLVHRKSGKGVCMPGGKIDEGETSLQAAQRELREETGVHVEMSGLLPLFARPCTNEDGTTSLATTYLATRWQGEVTGDEPELAPHWGDWTALCQNSPFADYNLALANEGFLPYLAKARHWTPALEAQMAALQEVVAPARLQLTP